MPLPVFNPTFAGLPSAVEEHGVDVVAVGGGQLEALPVLLVDELGAALGQRGGQQVLSGNSTEISLA